MHAICMEGTVLAVGIGGAIGIGGQELCLQ